MPDPLSDFHTEFFQGIVTSADADGRFLEDAFFDAFCNHLVEAGELETADRVPYSGQRGLRVDGYGGDPRTSDGTLSLIIADFQQTDEVQTLTATDMDAIFKRLANFLTKSLNESFRNSLEETAPVFGLADLIATCWQTVAKVRLFLISNRVLSTRVDGRPEGVLNGIPVTYNVWDLSRLQRLVAAGFGRESIEIDLEKDFGGPLPALQAHIADAGYQAYLIVIPGHQLAAIYDRYSARLLEQNVRVFLQARGSVNKGIRKSLETVPTMFFAYNNGISATADSVELRTERGGTVITSIKNLQIVNGGQTTASIAEAARNKVNLASVFVQMKLSIIDPAKALDVVPKISEFANSQNRVNAADFFANHPFHQRMEAFSRRIYAPSQDGSFRESKWFYERARGQYADARGKLTPTQRKKFDLEYPKSKVFDKTDLAKYLMLWRGHPDIVSRGAQKNFAEFAKQIGVEWSKREDDFNELFYRQAVAKAIIFRRCEQIVTNQDWYQGGYRANIVAYAIAKIGHDVASNGKAVDLDSVWKVQALTSHFEDALAVAAKAVHEELVNPPTGTSNVTEWAKQQPCWVRMQALTVRWPAAWGKELRKREEDEECLKNAKQDQKLLNGIEAQNAVFKAGGMLWQNVRRWGNDKALLTPAEDGILAVAAAVPDKIPSEKQSQATLKILNRLRQEGCALGDEIGL